MRSEVMTPFNRTIKELKHPCSLNAGAAGVPFNRTIKELKQMKRYFWAMHYKAFNRTIKELKPELRAEHIFSR